MATQIVEGQKTRRNSVHDRRRNVARPPAPKPEVPTLYHIYPNAEDPTRGKLIWTFHEGQWRVWTSGARFILMAAGTQGGKTAFGPWWLYREILAKGAGDYIAGTSNYDLFSKKMLPEMLHVFVDVLKRGKYHPSLRMIELCDLEGRFWAKRDSDPMWGRVMLLSAEAGSGLESSTAKAAWLDEVGQDEWDVTQWEAILRRLAINRGRALMTTTVYNIGWLKSEVYDRWLQGDPDYDVIQFDSTINPAFPKDEFERARRTMPGWRFEMFYRGQFTYPEHLIYGAFRDELGAGGHMVEDFEVPSDWARVVGVDFGGANHCEIELACDPKTGIWYAVHEQLGGGRTVIEMARDDVARYAHMASFVYVGGAPGESQNRRDFAASGLPVKEPPIEDVELGIDRVVRMIKEDKFRVFRSLTGLRSELRSYRRKLDDVTGRPTDDIQSKHTFHRLDALRYAALYIVERMWGGAILDEQLRKYAEGASAVDNTHLPTPTEVTKQQQLGVLEQSALASFNSMTLSGIPQRDLGGPGGVRQI